MYKKPQISKSLIYLDLGSDIFKRGLPYLNSINLVRFFVATKVVWSFSLYHFNFWPGFIISILYFVLSTVLETVVYELPVDVNLFMSFLSNLIFVVIAIFFVYISEKKMGQLHL